MIQHRNKEENILDLFREMLRRLNLADILQEGITYDFAIRFKMENLDKVNCRLYCKKIDLIKLDCDCC